MATVKATGTSATSKKIYNPKFIFITPWTDDKTPGTKAWRCEEVIRDTTTITQEENTENPVENELSSSPIINNIIAGKYTIATEIGDLQPDLLKDLLGFNVNTAKDKAYAPEGYTTKFAEFALVFQNPDGKTHSAAILPKVQLNPTITIDSLSTSLGRIVLSGSAQAAPVGTGSDVHTTPFYLDYAYTLPPESGTLDPGA